jgi:hypothetical protein
LCVGIKKLHTLLDFVGQAEAGDRVTTFINMLEMEDLLKPAQGGSGDV